MYSISPTRQAKIDDVHLMLSIFAVCTMMQNGVSFFNINHHAEDLYCQLLNALHKNKGWKLENANVMTLNQNGYDLVDKNKGIYVQVTAERSKTKLVHSLSGIPTTAQEFYFVCFNIVPPPVKQWAAQKFTYGNNQTFNVKNDVITLPDIAKQCLQLSDDDLNAVWEIVSSFVRGTQPKAVPKNTENITQWIVQSSDAYKRFSTFRDCDDAAQLDAMIRPEVMSNWSIMDMSADLLTLKGIYLSNNTLVKTIDALCSICDYFAMISRITTSADVDKLHSKSTQGCKLILEILEVIAQMNSVTKDSANTMFFQYVNS